MCSHPFAGGPLKAPLLGAQRTAASAACESPSPCGWSWRAAPEGLPRLAELRARDKNKSQHSKGRKPLRHGSAVPPPLAGNVKNLSCKKYPNSCQRFPFLFIGCFALAYFFCRGLPLLSGRMGTTLFSMSRRIFLNK